MALPVHFHIQENLTLPKICAVLRDGAGDPLNLAASTVTFSMRAWDDNAMKVSAQAATIVVPAAGSVEYQFAASETNEVGDYWGWFEVTSASGTYAAPNPMYIVVHVTEG